MDCVGCDKCRLWGKIQTTGIATALKILFELDEKALECVLSILAILCQLIGSSSSPHANSDLLQRSEVVALMNTLFRFSESLAAVDDFRRMWRQLDAPVTEKIATEVEQSTSPHVSIVQMTRLFPFQNGCLRNNLYFSMRNSHPRLIVMKTTQETSSMRPARNP